MQWFSQIGERLSSPRVSFQPSNMMESLRIFPSPVAVWVCTNATSRLARFYDGRPYLSHLVELAQSLRLGDRLTFAGNRSHFELQESYRGADLFVLPTTVDEILAHDGTRSHA